MVPPRFRPRLVALEGREVPAALLQVINNSPYPAAAKIDVYINNLLVPELTGLGFRQATPYLTQPSAVPLVVSVRPAGATAATQPFLTQTLTLADSSATVAVALGDPAQTQTAVTKFQVVATPAARTQSAAAGKADFSFVHGSPDAPPIDLKLRGTGTVADDVPYGGLAPGYTTVAPGKYSLDVTLADGVSRVGSFAADLSGAADKAITVLASGFVGTLPAGAPAANKFGLLAVNSDGTTALLPAASPPPLATQFAAGAVGKLVQYTQAGGVAFTASPFGEVAIGGQVAQNRVAVADVTADGVPDVIAGVGPGALGLAADGPGGSRVVVIDGASRQVVASFDAFEPRFTGGVFVAAGDLTGDGRPDIIVTPDQGGGPVVAVYDSSRLAPPGAQPLLAPEVARFFGIEDPDFRGGARAAVGDVNGDGRPDLIVAAGFGGGPRVAVFNGASATQPPLGGGLPPKLLPDFFVFEPSLRNGVFVTAGDINGDGAADVIAGGGPGGGPRVFALSGRDLTANPSKQVTVANFFAGDPNNRDGVRLAAKDLDGDQLADLVVGLGSSGTPQVRAFRGKDLAASVNGPAPPAVPGLELNPFTSPGAVYVG